MVLQSLLILQVFNSLFVIVQLQPKLKSNQLATFFGNIKFGWKQPDPVGVRRFQVVD